MFDALPPDVNHRANQALSCLIQESGAPKIFMVADMNQNARQKRLYVFDLRNSEPTLMLQDYVSHGAGSDRNKDGYVESFSNRVNSNQTSLGLYRIAEPYYGKYGRSYRLDGLMESLNDQARTRAVVMHPAHYVRPGQVGRSFGCPAVRFEVMKVLVNNGLEDAYLYIDSRQDTTLARKLDACSTAKVPVLAVCPTEESLSGVWNQASAFNPSWSAIFTYVQAMGDRS